MINPGDTIYSDTETGKVYSKPGKTRMSIGQLDVNSHISLKEGTKMGISITKKGIERVEQMLRERKANEVIGFEI